MRSPLLDLPGAIEARGVAEHYGAPLIEQRSLDEGNAVVDLSNRGVVTVEGPDRLSWLNSFTSQELTGLRAGESAETLLLDANGRIEHALRLFEDGERSWLLLDEGAADAVVAFLNRMRFALRVEVADVSADYATLLLFEGGDALPAIRELGPAVDWVDPWSSVVAGGAQYATAEHPGEAWSAHQLVVPTTALSRVADLARSGRIRTAGLAALSALEVLAWRPAQHADADERALPHEFDWLHTAVHLTKGCYRGQETVAKVHNLGHPPRRFTLLHVDGSGGKLPAPGALVYLAGTAHDERARPVGRITRSALHYEWGAVALALLKRSVDESAELETLVDAEAVACSQEIIVPASAGATRPEPRLRRL